MPNPLLSCRCNCERAKTANNRALALACPCTHAQSLTHVSWCKRSRFNARKHASRDILVRQSHGLLQDDFYDSLHIASSSAVRSSAQATSPRAALVPLATQCSKGKALCVFRALPADSMFSSAWLASEFGAIRGRAWRTRADKRLAQVKDGAMRADIEREELHRS